MAPEDDSSARHRTCGPVRPQAVMLVANPCVNDSRVIRAAEAIAAIGFETTVLATWSGSEPREEERNGVRYRRLGRRRQARGRLARLAARFRSAPPPAAAPATPPASGPGATAPRAAPAVPDTAFWQTAAAIAGFAKRAVAAPVRTQIEVRRMRRLFESTLVDLAPDVIHAHDLVTLPVAGVAARRTGARLIYDAHELEVHRNTRSGPYDKIYRYLTERRHIRAADAVVTVSDSIARHLARAYSIPLPAVVMNAADGTLPAGYERDLRTDLALPRDTPLAVYVGRITVGRGLEQTVAALAHWPELHLALLGTQHPSTAAAVRGAMRRLGVADRVHFMDPVPPHAVAAYVATADVSVVPIQNICLSYYYCLPNKLIESTLAGVPVVVSNLPELRRFVEFGNSGVVMDQTDPRDIARALRAAYADRDRIRPSADRLARILEVYGWDRQREVLCDIYRRFGAVATSSPRAPDGLRRNDRLGTEIRAER